MQACFEGRFQYEFLSKVMLYCDSPLIADARDDGFSGPADFAHYIFKMTNHRVFSQPVSNGLNFTLYTDKVKNRSINCETLKLW